MFQSCAQSLLRWRFRNAAAAPLRECWQQLPARSSRRWLAVDLETSALNPQEGELVSIAWVPIEINRILVADGAHVLVSGTDSVGSSATIHQIRDCERAQGQSAEFALLQFLQAAAGRVLLFHHATMDMAFFDALCRQYFAAPLLLPYRDTLQTERRRLLRQQEAIAAGDLRLARCRQRYHLPDYPAHNAFNDALATAELFLAQHAGR